ncbi:hypothetical protein EV2_036315 [Malus domestica]
MISEALPLAAQPLAGGVLFVDEDEFTESQLNPSSSSATLAAMDELLELCNSYVPPLLSRERLGIFSGQGKHVLSRFLHITASVWDGVRCHCRLVLF